jgi:hypothetical protein
VLGNFVRKLFILLTVVSTKLVDVSAVVGLRNKQIPVGALARFILARYASSGSEALMEIGPRVIGQMNEIVDAAEAENTDAARLDAYNSLTGVIRWLNIPLTAPDWRPGGR